MARADEAGEDGVLTLPCDTSVAWPAGALAFAIDVGALAFAAAPAGASGCELGEQACC